MPGGLLVTVPEPAPNFTTLSVATRDPEPDPAKLAVQVISMSSLTLPSAQSGSPLQPVKTEPGAGIAVKLTTASNGNGAEQVAPQSSPAGSLVTVPLPVPAFVSPSVAKSPS